MSTDHLMLSVSGCRGIVGTSLTPQVISSFAATVGTILTQSPDLKRGQRPIVVVGRDGRSGSPMVRDAARAGLLASGCDVIDVGVAMTPTCGVAVDAFNAHAGIVLTASHNPQQWNGLKVLLRGKGKNAGILGSNACAPSKALADSIIARYRTDGPCLVDWTNLGDVDDAAQEAIYAHAGRAAQALDKLKITKKIEKAGFKVVLDSVNGAGRIISPGWLEAFGCKVTRVGDDDSGIFPHTPEPTADNLVFLGKLVKKAKAHVGFAQDPDADRLAIIDERGSYIGEEYTLVLATMALGELGALKKGQKLVVNLSTSRMIEDVAAKYGCSVVRSAVGEANVVEMMKTLKSPIGGEGNGGVIWPAVTYIRDSLGAMGLVLGLMAQMKKPLSEIVRTIPSYAIVKRKVECAQRAEAQQAVEKIAEYFSDEQVDRQDGTWVNFKDRKAWLHVRASNTEPIMRLIAEAPSTDEASSILDEAARVISK